MATHFQDGLAVGSAGYPPAPSAPGLLGRQTDTRFPHGGVTISPVRVYRLANLAAASTTNLNAGTTTYSGTGVSVPITAGTGVTSTTLFGSTVYDIVGLVGERAVQVTPGPGNTGASVTITGYDMYEVPLTATFSSTASGGSAAVSNKTFRYVSTISTTGNTTSSLSFGVSDRVGFPVAVANASDFIPSCSGTIQTNTNTGFTAADATNPATALTNNVRGSYTLQTATTGSNVVTIFIFPSDVNTTSGAWGVPQV